MCMTINLFFDVRVHVRTVRELCSRCVALLLCSAVLVVLLLLCSKWPVNRGQILVSNVLLWCCFAALEQDSKTAKHLRGGESE